MRFFPKISALDQTFSDFTIAVVCPKAPLQYNIHCLNSGTDVEDLNLNNKIESDLTESNLHHKNELRYDILQYYLRFSLPGDLFTKHISLFLFPLCLIFQLSQPPYFIILSRFYGSDYRRGLD
jgi:hypothetical protein